MLAVTDQILLAIKTQRPSQMLEPYLPPLKDSTPPFLEFYTYLFTCLQNLVRANLFDFFAKEMQCLDTKLNIRYIGVLMPCKKTVLVVRYLLQSLCPNLSDQSGAESQAGAMILDNIVLPVAQWVSQIVEPPGKYSALVHMENIYYMWVELCKVQSPLVYDSISELNAIYKAVLAKYIDELFAYNYASLLKDEQKCKDREAVKRLYEKTFPKAQSITAGVDKMTKRCTKHLSADTSESLLPLCRASLESAVNERILGVLGSLPQ